MYQITGSHPSTEHSALDIGRLVRPVRLRLGLQVMLYVVLRGVALALAAAAAVIALAHLTPWPDDNPLGGTIGLIAIAVTLIACATCITAARAWPAEGFAVRHADRALGLKDRLTTAREYADRHGPMLQLQRDELDRRLRDLDLRRAVRLRFPARDALFAGAAALLLLGAALLPNPQATARAQRAQQASVAHHAAQRTAASIRHLQQVTQQTGRAQAGPNRNAQAVTALLRQLQKQLLQAKTPAQALKTLAAAQQQLQHLNLDSRQAQQQLAALAHALANGQSASVARNIASGNSAATQQSLSALAKSFPHLSQQQQAQLARSLQQAAASTSGSLSDALRQAAQALAQNNRGAAARALQKAGGQIAAAQQRAAAAQTAAQAQQDVSRIKQDVADGVSQDRQAGAAQSQQAKQNGANNPQSGQQQGSSGQQAQGQQGTSGTQQTGKGGKNGGASGVQASGQAGNRSQHGQGAAQQGTAAGQKGAPMPGSGNQQGTGAQQSNGSGHASGGVAAGSGGQGNGGHGYGGGRGGNNGAGTDGRYQSVYVPGQRGSGPSITTTGPMGRSVPVESSAFQQLLPQYSNAAEASMGRTSLPPDVQAQVKRYFQALEQN